MLGKASENLKVENANMTTSDDQRIFIRKHNPFLRPIFLRAFFQTASVCHILFSPSFLFLFPCRNNSSNSSFFPHPPVFSPSSSAAKAKIWWRRGGGIRGFSLRTGLGRGENVNSPKVGTFFTFSIECDIVFCRLIWQFFRCFQVRRIPFRQTISHTEKEEEELGAAAAAEIEKEEEEELKDVLLLPPSSPAKKVAFAVKMERQKQRILYFFYSRSLFLFLSLSFPPLGLIVLGWCHRQIY